MRVDLDVTNDADVVQVAYPQYSYGSGWKWRLHAGRSISSNNWRRVTPSGGWGAPR